MNAICVLILVVAANGPERQPVATDRSAAVAPNSNHAAQSTTSEQRSVNPIASAISGVASLTKAAANVSGLVKPNDDKSDSAQPVLAWVHLSKRYMSDYVERNVDRRKPVQDLILGTPINGESHTTGKTRLVLYPNERGALGDVEFVGEVHADTIGHNGPATIHYVSESNFRARKRLMMGQSGLIGLPAYAEAPTQLTPTGLSVSLPGLRGRIGQRIAWRRVNGSLAEANAITSDHTADDIRHDLDKKINESLASMQAKVKSQIAKINDNDRNGTPLVRSRSTESCIEVALCRRDDRVAEMPMPTFPVSGNPDIAVRVHRSVLARVASDPQLREKFAPLLSGALVSRPAATNDPRGGGKQLHVANWSMAGDWLAVDLNAGTPGDDRAPARFAMDEDDAPRLR